MTAEQRDTVSAALPFVETLARRVASTMPYTIELGDLIQSGVVGLIDAAKRFDETRGIKLETFAERRIRGAMIDALRRDAWPRGVRRVRRELEEARAVLRQELGAEPTLSELAQRVGADEMRLGGTIVRISTIESTSPFADLDSISGVDLPPVLKPAEPENPFTQCATKEQVTMVRKAIGRLPARERVILRLYYYDDLTMKQIGVRIGVNESRVSQLHARALRELRKMLKGRLRRAA